MLHFTFGNSDKRAFGRKGIRPVSELCDIIREAGKIERHVLLTVLRDAQVLKIGNPKAHPEDLKGPLAALVSLLDLARNPSPVDCPPKNP